MRTIRTVSIPSGTDLTKLYREIGVGYPKFFKMDTLCKLGFLATELLLHDESERFIPREDRAVITFSRHGCECNDRHYIDTLADYPSPALFVYTLPNIVGGEIAIRNRYEGETSSFIMERYDSERIHSVLENVFLDDITSSAIVAWIDCISDSEWTCQVSLIEKQ